MRVYSFQHKNVLDILLKDNIYECTIKSEYREQAPILYNALQDLLYSKTGISSFPIFCWSKIEKVKDMNIFSEDIILNTFFKVNFDQNTYLCLELDIPDVFVVEHDFFDFACYKADEEEYLVSASDLRKFIFDSVCSGENVQACFPIINLEWLNSAYEYSITFKDNSFKVKDIKFNKVYSKTNTINKMNSFV